MSNRRLSAVVFLSLAVAIFVFYVNIRVALIMSQPNQNEISPGWQQTCMWLKNNTESPSDYYDTKSIPKWGVMSWWDYGYWITRDGQRPAMCNPGSNIRYEVARHLLSADYKSVHASLVQKNIKYIVIDYLMVTSKFYAIDTLAHAPLGEQYLPTRYQQDYIYWDKGKDMPVMLNYEEYYRSLVARLYNFNGMPVRSPGTPVFTADKDRNIKGIKDFPTLEEASQFQIRNGGIIAGSDPFLSPWAMDDKLDGFKLVYESPSRVKIMDWTYSEVKVFEVVQ